MLKAIFCDMDGTLTEHAAKPIDSEMRRYIIKLRKKGIKFDTPTSHSIDGKLTFPRPEYYKFYFMVLENGSVIYLRKEDGSYGKLKSYDKENRQKLQDLKRIKKVFLKNSKKIKTSGPIMTHNEFYEIFYMERIYLLVYFKGASFSIRPLSANDDINTVIRFLRNEYSGNKLDLKFIEPGRTFVEIGIANKTEGVKYLTNYLGLKLDNVSAIGDAENDMEMLKNAGLPACPADTPDKIKSVLNKKRGIVASKK